MIAKRPHPRSIWNTRSSPACLGATRSTASLPTPRRCSWLRSASGTPFTRISCCGRGSGRWKSECPGNAMQLVMQRLGHALHAGAVQVRKHGMQRERLTTDYRPGGCLQSHCPAHRPAAHPRTSAGIKVVGGSRCSLNSRIAAFAVSTAAQKGAEQNAVGCRRAALPPTSSLACMPRTCPGCTAAAAQGSKRAARRCPIPPQLFTLRNKVQRTHRP